LRQAVAEWQGAGGRPGNGPYQIFEQQAAQGYYNDAAATGHLFGRPDDVRWSVVELARIRAENGDVQGAKNQIRTLIGSDVGAQAAEAIALTQAHNGDLPGALETISPLGDSNHVLGTFAQNQIEHGDFDGALTTAGQMNPEAAAQVFYRFADALRDRGGQKRVRGLASHMSNRQQAAALLEVARFKFQPRKIMTVVELRADPCSLAYHGPSNGNFAAVDALIEQNKCSYVSFVAIEQYAVDPAGAERLLRANADPQDLIRGLDGFAMAAARKSDILAALRFLGNVESLQGPGNAGNAVQVIARCWTIRDGPKAVLRWAHSRPSPGERIWALIGVAQALGHARPRASSGSRRSRDILGNSSVLERLPGRVGYGD
jgi:hypothetical protein